MQLRCGRYRHRRPVYNQLRPELGDLLAESCRFRTSVDSSRVKPSPLKCSRNAPRLTLSSALTREGGDTGERKLEAFTQHRQPGMPFVKRQPGAEEDRM